MWEAARFLARRHEVVVVSADSSRLPEGVLHSRPSLDGSRWNPIAFRRAAAANLADIDADLVVSYGSQCPPGDIWVVNSVHRSWLAHAGPVITRGHQIGGRVRYLIPEHAQTLWLERTYYGACSPRHLVPCSSQVATDLATYYRLGNVPTYCRTRCFAPRNSARTSDSPSARRCEPGSGTTTLTSWQSWWPTSGNGKGSRRCYELCGYSTIGTFTSYWRVAPHLNPYLSGLIGSLGEQVRYVGSASDVGALHAAADLFVMPTQYEAFSLAVVEALASGLGVLSRRCLGSS